MSRVRYGENLFLEDFKPDYIKANDEVEKKMASMKLFVPYNFKKVYTDNPIFEDNDRELKIGYINIRSLYEGKSDLFLNADQNLLNYIKVHIVEL